MTDKKWGELKNHVKGQIEKAEKIDTPAGRIISHVWSDVKNKMWSIERGERK